MGFYDGEAIVMLRSKKGLVLVELVVALALSCVLVLILTDVLMSMQQHKEQVLAENELAENLNYALGELAYDLRQAVWVIPQTDSVQLVLINEAGDTICYLLSADTMSDEHPYALQGQVLYRLENGGRKQPIANFLMQMTINYQTGAAQTGAEESITAVQISLSGQAGEKMVTMTRTLPVGGYWWRAGRMEKGI